MMRRAILLFLCLGACASQPTGPAARIDAPAAEAVATRPVARGAVPPGAEPVEAPGPALSPLAEAAPDVLTSPALEPVQLSRSTSALLPLALALGPAMSALGLDAATGLPDGAHGHWVCSPAGAGSLSACEMIAVVARGPS